MTIPKDPAVESLFFLHRSRWHQHYPEQRTHPDQSQTRSPTRKISASDVIRRSLQPVFSNKRRASLFYMQPVQDLSVDDRVSRTQFQYTLEDPSADELYIWAPQMLAKLKDIPGIVDVASDQQTSVAFRQNSSLDPRHCLAPRHQRFNY